jgi:two-component system, OmpR family, response regulator ChvI
MPTVLHPTHADGATLGGKILLVDDDEDLLEALAFLLRRAGFSPLTATSLPTAIRLFDCERPELGVLDVDLGRWNGLDLLQQLRKRSSIPILMLTGSVSEHLKARSMALGADDCLTKPISAAQLIARIRAVLAQHLHAREQAEIQLQRSSALRELGIARDGVFNAATRAAS